MQFADDQFFWWLGRLCLRAVTMHAFPFKGGTLEPHTIDALRRFTIFLEHAKPRSLGLSFDSVWHIYTDACYEPQAASWKCGLGGVLVNPLGEKVSFFALDLSEQQMNALGDDWKKTIIFRAELLAMVLAFSVRRSRIMSTAFVCFMDNNSARDVAISGCGRNSVANSLIEFLLKLEMASNVTPWYARVPTPSNVADSPS